MKVSEGGSWAQADLSRLGLSIPSLNLHPWNEKVFVPVTGPRDLRKFWGKKSKATTKLTLQELPINTVC